MFDLHLGEFVERAINWLTHHLAPIFDGVSDVLDWIISSFTFLFTIIPFYVIILIVALAAWKVAGKGVAIFTILGLVLVESMGLWTEMMQTLSLVTTSTIIAVGIGIPLGIWMSRSQMLNRIMRPLLDFMQTMPAFVYLIPAIYFFGLGEVSGSVATVIFAMPPAVRMTNLGIRQVSEDVIEAAKSFGCTSRQRLFMVEMPLARPTIMAGLNQTIMLALSMVVIASMIGAEGLGQRVLEGISRLDIGKGFEAGLSVVILAMILDRITQGLSRDNSIKKL